MLEIINVKIEKETKEKLERLVRLKAYRNKSEAVRRMLEEYFAEHPELFGEEELTEAEREADKMSDSKWERLAKSVFSSTPRTAVEIISEERDRFP